MQKTPTVTPTSAAALPTDEELPPLTMRDRVLIMLSLSSRYIALLVACVATCGSLFMSDVLRWPPCFLCWYQRILMYPLSIIIAVGILRRDRGLHLYVLPLSLFGAGMSIYHYAITKNLLPPPACVQDVPCTTGWLNWLGFINVPFLALTAFLIISFMMLLSSSIEVEEGEPQAGDEAAPALNPLERFGVVVPVVVIMLGVVGAFVTAALVR